MIVLNKEDITPKLAKAIMEQTSLHRTNSWAMEESKKKGIKNICELTQTYIKDERKYMQTDKSQDIFEYNLEVWSPERKPKFRFDKYYSDGKEKVYMALYNLLRNLPTDNLEKMSQLLGDFCRIVDYTQPLFAWGGDFYYLLKFEEQDARKHFFPVTFYGKEMTESIGREKLLSAPVWKAEELGGGVFLQVQENPFYKAYVRSLKKVEKYLGLGDDM